MAMDKIEKQVTTIKTMDTQTVYDTIDYAIRNLERLKSNDSVNLSYLESLRKEIFMQLPKMKEPTRFGTRVHAKSSHKDGHWYVGDFIRITPSIAEGKWMSETGNVLAWHQLEDVKDTWA